MLLTTVPVASLDDALQRIQWYTRRWGIEVFHRIIKSGCRIEDRQFAKPPTVWKPASPSTWSSPGASTISPGSGGPPPNCPVPSPSSPSSGRPWSSSTPASRRRQPPSLCQMILLIAQLGGFLARKSDGQPGPQTLWRGLQRLDDITAAFRSYAIAYPLPP